MARQNRCEVFDPQEVAVPMRRSFRCCLLPLLVVLVVVSNARADKDDGCLARQGTGGEGGYW